MIRPIIIYPVPFDQWATFEFFVDRFTRTFKEFHPSADYEVWAVGNWGSPTDHVKEFFYGIRTKWFQYNDGGCDFGSVQYCLPFVPEDSFLICMTSRCYFHRHGWLERYLQAREMHGNALYSPFASHEGGVPHMGTRGYALDAGTYKQFPHVVNTRAKGQRVEVGDWCITRWFLDRKMKCWQVTFDGEQQEDGWRYPENIFRKGDQSNCLIHDKHTDLYRDADDQEKRRLEQMVNPPKR